MFKASVLLLTVLFSSQVFGMTAHRDECDEKAAASWIYETFFSDNTSSNSSSTDMTSTSTAVDTTSNDQTSNNTTDSSQK